MEVRLYNEKFSGEPSVVDTSDLEKGREYNVRIGVRGVGRSFELMPTNRDNIEDMIVDVEMYYGINYVESVDVCESKEDVEV